MQPSFCDDQLTSGTTLVAVLRPERSRRRPTRLPIHEKSVATITAQLERGVPAHGVKLWSIVGWLKN